MLPEICLFQIEKIKKLANDIPGILAVEMEGAAFAQVAFQENLDWIVLRVISDGGDENAHDEFNHFLEKYKSKSFDLIKYFGFIINKLVCLIQRNLRMNYDLEIT